MPNYCNFSMRVKGKKANVKEFYQILEADYDYQREPIMNIDGPQRHFSRIFNINFAGYKNEAIYDCSEDTDDVEIDLVGDCAWSVYSCMCKGNHTYYNSLKEEYKEKCLATNLEEETRLLYLKVEIYSEEPGVGFQEHMIYDNGKCLVNDCVDYYEDYDEESDEYTPVGGFEEWTFSI